MPLMLFRHPRAFTRVAYPVNQRLRMCALGQCVCREESGSPEAIWQSDSRLSSGQMVRISQQSVGLAQWIALFDRSTRTFIGTNVDTGRRCN